MYKYCENEGIYRENTFKMTCKNCKYYEKGFDGKPGNCLKKIADTWKSYDLLKIDGFGYSDQYYGSSSVLFVGENFGCIHFEKK